MSTHLLYVSRLSLAPGFITFRRGVDVTAEKNFSCFSWACGNVERHLSELCAKELYLSSRPSSEGGMKTLIGLKYASRSPFEKKKTKSEKCRE